MKIQGCYRCRFDAASKTVWISEGGWFSTDNPLPGWKVKPEPAASR